MIRGFVSATYAPSAERRAAEGRVRRGVGRGSRPPPAGADATGAWVTGSGYPPGSGSPHPVFFGRPSVCRKWVMLDRSREPPVRRPEQKGRSPVASREPEVVTRHPSWWTELDDKAVDTARLLAADAVQKAGSGHPGTAMSLAPLAYLLYQRVMRHDPTDPEWIGRDRFLLSNGHSSLTQYCQLFLSGYGLELSDLEALRTWDSRTPGHPEYHHTAGVEVTTGPLGQGVANGVGMAMAARRERGLFDPDTAAGESPFDHFIYVIAGDGCMEEGVSSEASSLAGHQQLGNLILIYDDNHISIEDDTAVAFSEDVVKRYEAYGWHTQRVDSGEDVVALERAIARRPSAVTDRPSFIAVRTIIGWPAPTKQNTGKAHGSALGEDEIRKTKEILGFDPDVHFAVAEDVLAHTRQVIERGREAHAEWQQVVRRVGGGQPGGVRAARAAAEPHAARRLDEGAADLADREGRQAERGVHPQGVRRGAHHARAGAARAVGRLGRPRREQQHHDGGRAELRPGRAPDEDVAGRPVRAHPALRHPRARDGRDHQRHHRARRHSGLRRHVPGVQRLHAPAGAAGRADAAARRSSCGRTTRSASAATARPTSRSSTSPRCARSPASTSSARPTRTRPPSCWRADPGEDRRPGRHRAVPAEPAGARPGRRSPTPARAPTSSRRRRQRAGRR